MSAKKTPTIISLVKIKSWYIPADPESYSILKGVGVPLLKIHVDFLPTLQLVTKKNNIRAQAKSFQDVFNEVMDKVGTQWIKGGRKCIITDKRLTFTADLSSRNKKAIAYLENYLSDFFARWGFSASPEYSESQTKAKLVFDFKFNPNINPIIPTVEEIPQPEMELILGFTKIKLSFLDNKNTRSPSMMLQIFIQCGGDWQPLHSGTFTNSQIGDLTPILNGLGILHSRIDHDKV